MGAETWAFSKDIRQSEITPAVTKGRTASWMSIFSDLMFVAKQINMLTWLSAQSFGLALLIYFIMARFALVPFLRWLEVLAAKKVGRSKV